MLQKASKAIFDACYGFEENDKMMKLNKMRENDKMMEDPEKRKEESLTMKSDREKRDTERKENAEKRAMIKNLTKEYSCLLESVCSYSYKPNAEEREIIALVLRNQEYYSPYVKELFEKCFSQYTERTYEEYFAALQAILISSDPSLEEMVSSGESEEGGVKRHPFF